MWNNRFPGLPALAARAIAPARRPGPPQLRMFHLAYAVVTLPAILALHAALWVLATPLRLLLVALALVALSHSGALIPVPAH